MRLLALLSWYDEPPSQLAATVASLNGLCDGVIAVDGAYLMFPGSLRHPVSGTEQVDTIAATAKALGMSVTIHQPQVPWGGNEVEKRQFMFDLATMQTTEDDWLFLIDADEQVSQLPGDTREHLEKTDLDAAEVLMWEHPEDRVLSDGSKVGYLGNHSIRRMWRALRGITVGPAHHQFSLEDGRWLSDAGRPRILVPALTLHDVRIEHRNVFRSEDRLQRKARYYADRDHMGLERDDD